jgi:MFS family permease
MNFNSHLHLNIHAHHQLKKLKEGIYSLYLVHSIRGFVVSLIGFFIPIYLLNIGFGLIEVLSFYGFRSFFIIFFAILTGGIGNKFGLKHTMAISLPLLLLYFVAMLFLEKNPSLFNLYILSILNAFSTALYWIPMHSLFARFSSKKKGSSQVGILLSLKSFSSIIAPLLGGFITIVFGFESLFIIAIIILIIPISILAHAKDIRPHIKFSLNDLSRFFKAHRRHFLSIMLDSFGSFADNVLWPLFVFLILANTMSVGIVGSLVGVGTILFTLLLSKIIAKHDHFLIMKIAAFMIAATWIIRYFTGAQISIYFVSLLGGLVSIMFSIPLASHTYQIAKNSKDVDEFIVFKEILVHVGQITAVIVSIILVSSINLSFLMTGVSYLLITLL